MTSSGYSQAIGYCCGLLTAACSKEPLGLGDIILRTIAFAVISIPVDRLVRWCLGAEPEKVS